jgi:hypothetical protein
MLQFAGLAAIFNTILPEETTVKITNSVGNFFNKKMDSHMKAPLNKTFKFGWINGYVAGVASGAALVMGGMYWWRKRQLKEVAKP